MKSFLLFSDFVEVSAMGTTRQKTFRGAGSSEHKKTEPGGAEKCSGRPALLAGETTMNCLDSEIVLFSVFLFFDG